MTEHAQSDEQRVRAVWKDVHLYGERSIRKHGGWVQIAGKNADGWLYFGKAEAWRAALQFTEQRLEEVRQIREEIAQIEDATQGLTENCEYWRCKVYERILQRLQSALATATQGMREEWVKEEGL